MFRSSELPDSEEYTTFTFLFNVVDWLLLIFTNPSGLVKLMLITPPEILALVKKDRDSDVERDAYDEWLDIASSQISRRIFLIISATAIR